MRVDRALGLREEPRGVPREVERVGTPVAGIAAPLDQPARLEVVDQRHHGGPVHPERVAQRLLGLSRGARDVSEEAEVPGVEAQRAKALGQALHLVKAELGEQESGVAGQRPIGRRMGATGALQTGVYQAYLANVDLLAGWMVGSFAVWLVGLGIGIAVLVPEQERAIEEAKRLVEAGAAQSGAALRRHVAAPRVVLAEWSQQVLVVVFVYLMVFQPGS